MEHRLFMFLGKLNGFLGAAGQHLADGKDNCGVGIASIPFGALDVTGAGRLLQLVAGVNGSVLGLPALRAPAAVGNSTLDGENQRGPVSAGLAA